MEQAWFNGAGDPIKVPASRWGLNRDLKCF